MRVHVNRFKFPKIKVKNEGPDLFVGVLLVV